MDRARQVVELSRLERVLLVAMVLVFGGVALCGWFAPAVLFDPIGVSFSEPAGPAEVRAAYGGLFGATALLFFAALREPERAGIAFRFGAIVLAGFVFGRCCSLVMDGVPKAPVAWLALIFESLGLVLCLRASGRRGGWQLPFRP